MRVAELADGFYPAVGSATGEIGATAEGMPDVDFEVITNHLEGTAITERFSANCVVHRFRPTDLGSRRLGRVRLAKPILFPQKVAGEWVRFARKLRYIERTRFDIVHFNGPVTNYAFFTLDRLLGKPALTKILDFSALRCAKVITFHGLPSIRTRSQVDIQNEMKQAQSFDSIIVVDRDLLSRVNVLTPLDARTPPVHFIPNGVDSRTFSFKELPSARAFRVGFLGRLSEEKGSTILAELARNLPSGIELHLAISGLANSHLAAALQQSGRVKVIRNLPYAKVPEFLESIHVLINPVLVPGVSRATLEAMSVGRPVIMPPNGDRYPLIDGITGFLCPPSATALRSLLARLAEDPQHLESMAKRCREVIEAEFDARLVASKVRAVFHEAGARSLER